MLKYRAKYAAIIAGVAAPIYFVVQLILGSDAGPSLIRTLWLFLVVFLVSLAVKWENKGDDATSAEPSGGVPGPPTPPSTS